MFDIPEMGENRKLAILKYYHIERPRADFIALRNSNKWLGLYSLPSNKNRPYIINWVDVTLL